MKAIRVHETGGPEVLTFDGLPDPTPGPSELLIEIEAIGVNFIEIYHREGHYPLPRPFTLGTEAAGVVRAVGASVTEFKPGDRVVSERGLRRRHTAHHGQRRRACGVRLRWKDDVRQIARLAREARHDGAVRSVERSGPAVRSADPESQGLIVSHPAETRRLRRDPRRA